MASSKQKVFTSGLGSVEPYAHLTKPDYGNEEKGFGNPRGVYKAALTLDNKNPRCQSMIDEIVAVHEAHYAERLAEYEANPPAPQRGKKPLLPYEGDMPFIDNGDGTTTFKFSCYASYQDKKTKETRNINLIVVDSKGKKLEELPLFIGAGSKIKVKYKLMAYPWNPSVGASVKLQLDSVMLVELATSGGGGSDWGDDTEEGGYEASKPQNGGWSQDDYDAAQSQAESGEDDDGDF